MGKEVTFARRYALVSFLVLLNAIYRCHKNLNYSEKARALIPLHLESKSGNMVELTGAIGFFAAFWARQPMMLPLSLMNILVGILINRAPKALNAVHHHQFVKRLNCLNYSFEAFLNDPHIATIDLVWILSARFTHDGEYAQDGHHEDASHHFTQDDKVRTYYGILQASVISVARNDSLGVDLKRALMNTFTSFHDELEAVVATYRYLEHHQPLSSAKDLPCVVYNGSERQNVALEVAMKQRNFPFLGVAKQLKILSLQGKPEHTGSQCEILKEFLIQQNFNPSRVVVVTDAFHVQRVVGHISKKNVFEDVISVKVSCMDAGLKRADSRENENGECVRLVEYHFKGFIDGSPSGQVYFLDGRRNNPLPSLTVSASLFCRALLGSLGDSRLAEIVKSRM